MLRSTGLIGRVFAFAALVMALLCASGSAQAATPPPDLAALEQQMAQLHVNSERISFQEEFSLGELGGGGIPLDLIIAGKGEFSDSPPEGQAVAGLFGLDPIQTRVIGDTVYTYSHRAAEVDGGRPWVRKKSKKPVAGVDPTNMLGSDQPGPQGTFSKLIEQLNGALAIVESGPVTVENQRVIEFDATLDPKIFLETIEASQPKKQKHPLGSLLTTPVVGKSPTKPKPPPSLGLEVFIAPNGVPVRERFTFSGEGVTLAVRVDTLAINIPVNVTAPLPAQTIDEAALKRIERRRAAQLLRRLRQLCRRQHGRRRTNCLHTIVQAGSSGASGESSSESSLL